MSGLYKDKLPAPQFSCGNCGDKFGTKAAKRKHKRACGRNFQNVPECPSGNEDEHLYSFNARLVDTPAIRARAKAEWDAMDWHGKLPDGWEYSPSKVGEQ